jgi:hypothetical protein
LHIEGGIIETCVVCGYSLKQALLVGLIIGLLKKQNPHMAGFVLLIN